jgi:hypothetical protein
MNAFSNIINMKNKYNAENNKNYRMIRKNIMEFNDIYRDNFNEKLKMNIEHIKKEMGINKVHLIDIL